jgi:hypothetical protein
VGDDDVVDEGRRRRQVVRSDQGAGLPVVDVRLAGARAGDEEPLVTIELDPGRGFPGGSLNEDRAVAGA